MLQSTFIYKENKIKRQIPLVRHKNKICAEIFAETRNGVNTKSVQWEQLNKFAVDCNTMFRFENAIKSDKSSLRRVVRHNFKICAEMVAEIVENNSGFVIFVKNWA